MRRQYVLQKWNEYRQTLREDLSTETLSEVRDAFYGGVIGALSIPPDGRNMASEECADYLKMLQEKVEEIDSHGQNQR